MIDVAFAVALTLLVMSLIALLTSLDYVRPPLTTPHRRAIKLPPFGLPWLGLYDGLDVPEHLRRAARPSSEPPLAPPASMDPYR
jgi:hypothetical protein